MAPRKTRVQPKASQRPRETRRPKAKAPTRAEPARVPEQASEADSDEPQEDEEIVEVAGELVDEGPATIPAIAAPPGPPKSSAIAPFDPLRAYLHEVQQHPLLTPQDEHELAIRYAQTGDVEAAARLVSANLRLVVKIAYEYRRAYRNIMDLVQEGNIGLMQAVKHYDPYRGVKLSSYAAWWIRAYILRFILNNWRLVKLGTTQAQRKLFFNLNKEKARLASMGIEPSSAEIAKRLNVDETEVIEMDRRLAARETSLDAPVGDTEGRPVARVELLQAPGTDVDVVLAEGQLTTMVRERLLDFRKTLRNDKDIAIFDERLLSDEPLTLQELGARFGVSRERVRQLEARMLSRLRDFLRDELGDAVEVT